MLCKICELMSQIGTLIWQVWSHLIFIPDVLDQRGQHLVLQAPTQGLGEPDQDGCALPGYVSRSRTLLQQQGVRGGLPVRTRHSNEPRKEVWGVVMSYKLLAAPLVQARTVHQYVTNRSRADGPVHQRAHQWDHFSITSSVCHWIHEIRDIIIHYIMQPYELLLFVKVYYVCKQRSTQ